MLTLVYYALAGLLVYFLLRRLVLEKFYYELRGKYVFITGCDSGFGHLLAIKLLANNVNVFAGCYTQQGGEELMGKRPKSGGELHTVRIDVTNDRSVVEARKYVESVLYEKKATLWGLVNNAGIFTTFGPDDWCGIDEYTNSLNVNTLGAIRVCHNFVPLIKKSKGRIVTMGSTAGRLHGMYVGPYVTAKFAVEAYMDCLRLELRPFGVSVHILEPGCFRTELLSHAAQKARVDKIWETLAPNMKAEYGEEFRENFEVAWQQGVNVVASPKLYWVVDTYIHALFGFWPRLRYSPGWDAIFLFVPISLMPTYVQDLLLSTMYRLQPGPKLVPAALVPQRADKKFSSYSETMFKSLSYVAHLAVLPLFYAAFLVKGIPTDKSSNHTVTVAEG